MTATWIKLSAQLLRLTGDSTYADRIERSAYNSLLGAQKARRHLVEPYQPFDRPAAAGAGTMRHPHELLRGQRSAGVDAPAGLGGDEGSRGPGRAILRGGNGPRAAGFGKERAATDQGDYPRHKDVEILVQPDAAESFTLSLRIPAWSWRTKVEVNGQAVAGIKPGRYARLAREWKPGDRVRVSFDLTIRVVREPGGSSHVAIMRGPIVLAFDKRITHPHAGITAAIVKADPQACGAGDRGS